MSARLVLASALVAASIVLGVEAGSADPEVFPGAVPEAAETAALSPVTGPVAVFRTSQPFGIVLNYYRFKRKQAVHVTETDLGARFGNIAAAFDRPDPPHALAADPEIRRFHLRRFGRPEVPPRLAAGAWRALARRHSGRTQLAGEGERVTLYRPYVSQRTFELIDQTVIVLRRQGGSSQWSTDSRGRR
jgi:hypothetical protein